MNSIKPAVTWARLITESAPVEREPGEREVNIAALQNALCDLVPDLGTPINVPFADATRAMSMAHMAVRTRDGAETLYPFHIDFAHPMQWSARRAFTGSYFVGTSVTYLLECELDTRLHVLEIGEHKGSVDVIVTTFPNAGPAVEAASALFVAASNL